MWASRGLWSFAPVLQFSWSSFQKPACLWPVVWGFLLGYLPLLPCSQQAPFMPSYPCSRDCYFTITLQARAKPSHLSARVHALPLPTAPYTEASAPPGVPQEAHGHRTPLVTDPGKAASRVREGSDWALRGAELDFSAHALRSSRLTPSNSEFQGRSAWNIGRDGLQAPISQDGTLWT